MRIYADSLLERKVTKLTQELKSLKTGQRYLTGQTMGYVSDSVNVNTKIYSTSEGGYTHNLAYNCFRVKFIGDHIDRTVVGDLKIKGILSNGTIVNLSPFVAQIVSDYIGKPSLGGFGQKRTSNKNEIEFYVLTVWNMNVDGSVPSGVSGSKINVACVSNDTGHLVVTQEYTYS